MSELTQRIAKGRIAQAGLYDDTKITAAADLAAQVSGSGIETIRVVFADQHGILRGKTVVASSLPSVLSDGLAAPSTLVLKDTSHRTVFDVWNDPASVPCGMGGASDLWLIPDAKRFHVLPWAENSAWLLCAPRQKSGAPLPFAPREVLGAAIDKLAARNLSLTVGLEVEFHVYARQDPETDPAFEPASATMPGAPVTVRNLAQGYQLLTDQQYDALCPVMELLREATQAVGLPLRSLEAEMGPSQFEFTFDPASPMEHADNMVLFRALVKEVCAQHGLHASFMSRPRIDNSAASGWHLHQSLCDLTSGENLMMPDSAGALSPTASGWIAGLLDHAHASCLLTTPTVNGYKRYRPGQLAPDRVQWGYDNRGAMVRALMAPGDPASRVENRVAEPVANPYYVFASQILSGLDGITRALQAPPAVETPYASEATALPGNLGAAIEAFEASEFYRDALGSDVHRYLATLRRAEWDRYLGAISEWEQSEYFNLF